MDQKIADLFKALDDDQSGFVTIGELRQGVRRKLVYSGLGLDDASKDLKQTVKFFEELDADGSGRLDHDEFAQLCRMLIGRAQTWKPEEKDKRAQEEMNDSE